MLRELDATSSETEVTGVPVSLFNRNMPAKIVSAIITFLVNVAAGVFCFLMLLVALNGFHGSDANYGIAGYLILALLTTGSMSAAAFVTTGVLIKRNFSSLYSALIAILLFSLFGIVLKVLYIGVGAVLAELARQYL